MQGAKQKDDHLRLLLWALIRAKCKLESERGFEIAMRGVPSGEYSI